MKRTNEDDEILRKHLTAFEVVGWTAVTLVSLYGAMVVIQFLLVGG